MCMQAQLCPPGLFVPDPWTVARQASLSMGFPRQEYWEWAAMLFCGGSSRPRNQNCINSLTKEMLEASLEKAIENEEYETAKHIKEELDRRAKE